MPRKTSVPPTDAPKKAAPKKPASKPAAKTAKPAAPKKKAAAEAAPVQTLQVEAAPAPTGHVHDLLDQLRRGDLASRSAAATALGQLGDSQACSALAEALRDPTAEVACEAASALGRITDPSGLHALIAVVLNSDGYFHSTVRTAAATSLGDLADPRSVEALLSAIHDPVGETSLAAVAALGKIGDSRARPALEMAVANFDGFYLPQVQQAAADALARIPG